jgi:hypothetical protein
MVTKKQNVIISGGKRWFSFLLFEYDFCLLNWIRVDFTPQIQKTNEQMVETMYDSKNTTRISKEVLLPDRAGWGITGTKGRSCTTRNTIF